METTIIISFLKALGIKDTKEFANKTFMTHPYKYSLYGLSDILSSYQIPNAGIRRSEEKITYRWNNRIFTDEIQTFKKVWSGAVLLAEPQDSSIEPDYKQYLKKRRMLNLVLK